MNLIDFINDFDDFHSMACYLVTICDDIQGKTSKVCITIGFYRAWSFDVVECSNCQNWRKA